MKGSINGIKCMLIDLLIWDGKRGRGKREGGEDSLKLESIAIAARATNKLLA